MKKLLPWGALAFVVFYITEAPQKAAGTAKGLGAGLAASANAFGDFLSALFT